MSKRFADGPLTEGEQEQLREFLARGDGAAMPLDAVDGMFAALVCSPVVAGPSEWMPLVFGGMPLKWRSIPEAEYFYSLMIRMWNDVATHIDGGTYEMLLPAHDLEDGTAIYYPHDWCQGFFDGMELHEAYWWDLSRDEVMEMIRPIADVLGDHALRSNPKVRARLKDLRVIDESEIQRSLRRDRRECVPVARVLAGAPRSASKAQIADSAAEIIRIAGVRTVTGLRCQPPSSHFPMA